MFNIRTISTLKRVRVALSVLGLIVSVNFLSTCASTNELSNNNIVLPDINSLSFETIDKPKNRLQTPVGTKHVYDPIQDPDLIAAFEGLVQARQQSGYFGGWSKSLLKRWSPGLLPEKSKITWKEFRQNHPNIEEYNKVIGLAKTAQYNDYVRAGCSSIVDSICHFTRGSRGNFGPCSEDETNWGNFEKSECETKTHITHDLIATPDVSGYYVPDGPVTPDDFCVNDAHIGDPKRGSTRDQFEDFFDISCNEFQK